MYQKQADDLPAHALAVMKATLDLCDEVFPSIRRKDLADTFVDVYFNGPSFNQQKPS